LASPDQQTLHVAGTNLPGVLKITPPTLHEDFRGEFVELYNEELYKAAGISIPFIQDDISVSHRHVLRGLHGDQATWKLVSCLVGRIYLVVVNNDENSAHFGKWEHFALSEKNRRQILIPPHHGNGHLVLSDVAVFHYKQSTYYDRESQFTIHWNDPRLGIHWPIQNPILSPRDSDAALLASRPALTS
jgi:dTDP-4-dehydrorhamnose 3,5-epimerase